MEIYVFIAITAVALVFALFSLAISLYSLGKPPEFPDESPEVADLRSRVKGLDNQFTDLQDKVTHWMRRESTRRIRNAGNGAEAPEPPLTESKQELRNRVLGHR